MSFSLLELLAPLYNTGTSSSPIVRTVFDLIVMIHTTSSAICQTARLTLFGVPPVAGELGKDEGLSIGTFLKGRTTAAVGMWFGRYPHALPSVSRLTNLRFRDPPPRAAGCRALRDFPAPT